MTNEPTTANQEKPTFERYAKVTYSGFPGTVQREAPGLPGMYEVRLDSGLVCADATELVRA